MPNTLYVGNLGSAVETDEVGRLFAPHGAVRSVRMTPQSESANGSRGAFVEMRSGEHAAAAIAALHGAPTRGGALSVCWADDRVPAAIGVRHATECSAERARAVAESAVHLLVVIDYRMARVYKTEFVGAVPERLVPYDDAGAGRHLQHVTDFADGKRRRELRDFFAAVAGTLRRARQILLFGIGGSGASAIRRLLAALDERRPDLRGRVIGSVVVDGQHPTEAQLLARARAFYASTSVAGLLDPTAVRGDVSASEEPRDVSYRKGERWPRPR